MERCRSRGLVTVGTMCNCLRTGERRRVFRPIASSCKVRSHEAKAYRGNADFAVVSQAISETFVRNGALSFLIFSSANGW